MTCRRGHRQSAVIATISSLVVVLGVLVGAPSSSAAASTCTTTTTPTWTATLCLSVAADGPITGSVPVTTTVEVSASGPRVAKVEFLLRDEYLLTDYQVPYTFSLDTRDFVDGPAPVTATAIFRDGSTSDPSTVAVSFANGVTTQPGPSGSYTPPTSPPATQADPLVLAAVGDGAGGEQAATDVTSMMAAWQPEMVTYLGDVYENGTLTEFKNWYGDSSSWYGRFRGITAPVVGNHEYNKTPSGTYEADGYFRYWNDIPHYYSFDAGGWHFIALDSTSQFNETDPGTPQYQWLAADLAARTNPCTVVMWHHPLNTVGSEGPAQRMAAMWGLLRQSNVSLVLNGHDHQYQHWTALDANQQADPAGVTQMVAGAGGHSSQGVQGSDPRVVATAQAYGALRLEVFPDRVDYTYRTPDGSTGRTLDSGYVGCKGLSPDTTAPSAPAGLTATLRAAGGATYSADLAWNAATDNRGVAQYRIRRDGVVLATIPSNSRTYTAKGLAASSSYSFRVTALDAAGNESPPSGPANLTTPAPQPVTETTLAEADTYISEQAPTRNYGRSVTLRHDSDPLMESWLRFGVTGSHPDVTRAVLRVWANQKSSTGLTARTTPTTWGELTLTAANAPTAAAVAGSTGAFAAGTWVDIDVTPAVVGNGTYSFKLSTATSTAFTIAGREAGDATAPRLIVDSKPPPDTTPPSVPTGLTASAPTQSRVTLVWAPSTDDVGLGSYTVHRDGVAVDSVPAGTTTWADADVNAGRTYTYTVDAVDTSENRSAPSAAASATPPDETPPELPDPFDVVLTGPTQVSLRWGASTDNVGVTGYRVKRGNPTLANLPASAESFVDDDVTSGRTYTYSLTATDAAGNRSQPVVATVTVPNGTGGTPPSVPANVAAVATGEHTVAVAWDPSTDDTGISGYEVFRGATSVALVSGSTTTWQDSDLTPATSYSYTVRAIDLSANYSAPSSPAATATTWAVDTTAPSVPGGVAAAGASLTSIALSWSTSTDNRAVAAYRVHRDGSPVADVSAPTTSWTDTGRTTGATHTYAVDAVDAAGNRSAASVGVSGRTQVPAPTTQTFVADADAYVNSASPSSKYGTATTLRLDGDPAVTSYLRFTVADLQPVVTSAVLRVYGNARNVSAVEVHTTPTTWTESTLTWATAPAFGGVVATRPPTAAAGWVDIPVTATVTANGQVTYVLTQPGATAVAYQSREAGTSTAPVLVVTSGY